MSTLQKFYKRISKNEEREEEMLQIGNIVMKNRVVLAPMDGGSMQSSISSLA